MLHDDDDEDPRTEASMYGVETLDDRGLVGVLLGKTRRGPSPRQLAERLLAQVGGVTGLGRCGPGGVASVSGIGAARALRIAASVELGRRLVCRSIEPAPKLDQPQAVAAFLTPRLGALEHEEMWVLSLDGCQKLRGMRRVAQGGLHAMTLVPADVLRAALWDGGSGFVLAHNHPSGRTDPSREDVETTVRIACAAESIGVPLLDHLILTASGDFTSMMELGVLADPRHATARRAQATS
jgi:DNA repair protein RadC